jgi:hypothetical protein
MQPRLPSMERRQCARWKTATNAATLRSPLQQRLTQRENGLALPFAEAN